MFNSLNRFRSSVHDWMDDRDIWKRAKSFCSLIDIHFSLSKSIKMGFWNIKVFRSQTPEKWLRCISRKKQLLNEFSMEHRLLEFFVWIIYNMKECTWIIRERKKIHQTIRMNWIKAMVRILSRYQFNGNVQLAFGLPFDWAHDESHTHTQQRQQRTSDNGRAHSTAHVTNWRCI